MTWHDRVQKRTEELGRSPTFEELLDLVRGYTMTLDEVEAQRESWVVGELMLAYPEIPREDAIAAYRKARDRR